MKRIAKAILDKNKTCGKNGAFDIFSQELSSENLRRVISTSMGQYRGSFFF